MRKQYAVLLFTTVYSEIFSIVLLLTAKRLLIGGKDAKIMVKIKRKHAEKFTVIFLYTVDQLDRFYHELKRGEVERESKYLQKNKRKKNYIPQTDE